MHLRVTSRNRPAEVLGEVLFGLGSPSGKIGPKTSDALPNDVKGPIILRVAGPTILGVIVPSDRRETVVVVQEVLLECSRIGGQERNVVSTELPSWFQCGAQLQWRWRPG